MDLQQLKETGRWGAINRAGVVVLEPSVNLDGDYDILIDFIGEWHLDSSRLFYRR
ncbi:MAG: hypothetical protein FWC79_05015 [Oscillospiraceae bacterium]|nr:hypothetical protein [Oscillospiraceae bacterium]